MSTGVNAVTGQPISGIDELRQRINRLFSTRKGSLPLHRRPYGSNLPNLLDKKITPEWRMDLFAETAAALADPENGFTDELRLQRTYLIVTGEEVLQGSVELSLDLELLLDGRVIRMDGVTI